MILWKLRLWLRRLRFAYDLVKTKLSESEAEAEEPNAHCDWFILPLLLPTPSVWFTIDLKRNVSSGVVSGVGRNGNVLILLSLIPSHLWPDFWFSLGHKRSYDTVPLTTPTPTPTSSLVKTSLYDLKKKKNIGVISSAISATELESDESERFHFFRLRLRFPRLCSAYVVVKTRLSESKAEAEG